MLFVGSLLQIFIVNCKPENYIIANSFKMHIVLWAMTYNHCKTYEHHGSLGAKKSGKERRRYDLVDPLLSVPKHIWTIEDLEWSTLTKCGLDQGNIV